MSAVRCSVCSGTRIDVFDDAKKKTNELVFYREIQCGLCSLDDPTRPRGVSSVAIVDDATRCLLCVIDGVSEMNLCLYILLIKILLIALLQI